MYIIEVSIWLSLGPISLKLLSQARINEGFHLAGSLVSTAVQIQKSLATFFPKRIQLPGYLSIRYLC